MLWPQPREPRHYSGRDLRELMHPGVVMRLVSRPPAVDSSSPLAKRPTGPDLVEQTCRLSRPRVFTLHRRSRDLP